MLFSGIGGRPAIFFRQGVDGLPLMAPEAFHPVHLLLEFFQQVQFLLNVPDFLVRQHGAVGNQLLVMDSLLVLGQKGGELLQGNVQEGAGADGVHHGNLGEGVITVACIRVRMGRAQNPQLLVIPE